VPLQQNRRSISSQHQGETSMQQLGFPGQSSL